MYPAGVNTRQVSFGPAVVLEDGTALDMQVTIKASRSLVWIATGAPLITNPVNVASADQLEKVYNLPVTDQDGYGDGAGNAISVADGAHSHYYTATVLYLLPGVNGKPGKPVGPSVKIGPFVLPTGDGSVVDIDNLIPAPTGSGTTVAIPDTWSTTLAEAQAIVASKGAAGGLAPLDSEAKLPEANVPDRLTPDALKTAIGAEVADPTSPAGTALSATFARTIQVVSDGTDQTAAINAALATAMEGTRKTVKLVGDFTISAPLVIQSDTTFDTRDAVITAGFDDNMLRNTAYTALRTTAADAVTTAGSATVTSASAAFTSADAGRVLAVTHTTTTKGVNAYGTILTVNSATSVTLDHPAPYSETGGVAKVYPRDHDITILSGKWDRGSRGGTAQAQHSLFLRRIDRLKLIGFNYHSTGGKYGANLGDTTEVYVSDVTGSSASNFVQWLGPAKNVVVERVNGPSGDDSVGFVTSDYASYNDVHGNIAAVTVRDVNANNPTRAVLFGCGSSTPGYLDGHNLTNVLVENVVQSGAGAGVNFGALASGTSYMDRITVRRVAGPVFLRHPWMKRVSVQEVGPVTCSPEVGGVTQTIESLTLDGITATSGILLDANSATTTITDLFISDVKQNAGTALAFIAGNVTRMTVRDVRFSTLSDMISLVGAGTLTDLRVSSLFANMAGNTMSVVRLNDTATLGTATFDDCVVTAVNTSSGILVNKATTGSTVGTVNVNRGSYTAIARLLELASGSSGTTILRTSDVSMSGCGRIAQAGGPTLDFYYSNLRLSAMVVEPLRIYSSGNLNIRGSGWQGYTTSAAVRSGAEVIRCLAPDFPVDVAILANNAGDMCNNTNGSHGAGTGRLLANGTAWKNLYTGTAA